MLIFMISLIKKAANISLAAAACSLFFSCSKAGDISVQNGATAFRAGRLDDALEFFTKAVNEERRYSDELVYNSISNIYAAKEDIANAAVYLEKAVEGKPDYRSYVTLGSYYQSLKNYEKADFYYNKAIKMNPKKGEAYASLGSLFIETNNLEKAVENLEKGVELTPEIAVIHANLALAYAMQGNMEKSDDEFKIADKMHCVNLDRFEEKIQALRKN